MNLLVRCRAAWGSCSKIYKYFTKKCLLIFCKYIGILNVYKITNTHKNNDNDNDNDNSKNLYASAYKFF
jgi:hypothetical protein